MSHTFSACQKCHTVNRIKIEKVKEAVCGKCKSPMRFHGLVSEATAQDFQKIINVSDKPVVVDFWASWCGPCKVYGPEFEKVSLQNDKAVFLKISTEVETQLSSTLGIRGIPCTIIFRDGKEIKRQAGAMDVGALNSFVNSVS
jgi:thioredoxin 2